LPSRARAPRRAGRDLRGWGRPGATWAAPA
jgi:hypothetical protein